MTECYHEALRAIEEGTFNEEKTEQWMTRLRSVYNRDFWGGYYLGRKIGEWSGRYGSMATRTKQRVGKITNFFSKLSVAEIWMEENSLAVGDEILIIGATTGVYEDKVSEIRLDLKPVDKVEKGVACSIPVKSLVRRGDQIFKWVYTDF